LKAEGGYPAEESHEHLISWSLATPFTDRVKEAEVTVSFNLGDEAGREAEL
jgi:hypothetical protein